MQMHAYIPKASRLEDYVTLIWEVRGHEHLSEQVLPQGVVEIVFNFSEAVHGLLPFTKSRMQAPRCFIQGLNTSVVEASYVGEHHLLGIRLQPHRVKELLGILPFELNNTTVDLSLLPARFDALWQQLADQDGFNQRVQVLENSFPLMAAQPCPRATTLSALFLNNSLEGFGSVDALARAVCYSTRQLSRVTQKFYGLSAEELVQYKKYLHSVNLMHQEHQSLTSVAYDAGFYDQAHFCKVFKGYTGVTPGQYQLASSPLPFHLFS
jgi:AraC-like DNA-binding protein